MDKPSRTLKHRLLAPLVYAAAIFLLFEDWFWDATKRVIARLPDLPFLNAIEQQIQQLPPYAALAAFALPGVLLFPVKLLALYAIARGHAMMGLTVVVLAKVVGTVLVTRLYALTKPTLLSLAWFARWHDAFIAFKNRMIARLRATEGWQEMVALKAAVAERRRQIWRALKARYFTGRLGRLIRKSAARRRARHR